MADEQYLTEKHYVVCDKGITPKQIKVTSQNFTLMSGHKAATVADKMLENNFFCVGGMMFAAGMAAGICACIPGPGWIVAAAIIAALAVVAVMGYMKCKAAAPSRVWTIPAPALSIQGNKALTLSSVMNCPAQGGVITPKATLWEAWGSQALTNLGHVANFAFGFLAGRGMGMIAAEGIAAGAAVEGGGMAAWNAGLRTAGQSFLNTAKKELVEQFTFKGFKNASTFCKIMRGLGIGGAYYDQYKIWSSDQNVVDKLKESGMSLVLGIFAAKGASTLCFPEGTKVHTINGIKNIEDINIGDLLLTYNEETGEQEYKPVLVKHERYTMRMLTMELPTGEFLEVTPEHRFYHNGEWIEAGSLRPGDLLHLKNGDYTTIMGIETLPRYQKVYNFDVQDNENYYVTEDGILVHNGYTPKQLQKIDETVENTIEGAKNGIRKEAGNYHGRLGNEKELDILSNPDGVYLSEGTSGRLIFHKDGDIVVIESMGSKKGQIVTSYGENGPRGDSGAAIFGGNPTDPGLPIKASDITGGSIPVPGGGTLPKATQIYP